MMHSRAAAGITVLFAPCKMKSTHTGLSLSHAGAGHAGPLMLARLEMLHPRGLGMLHLRGLGVLQCGALASPGSICFPLLPGEVVVGATPAQHVMINSLLCLQRQLGCQPGAKLGRRCKGDTLCGGRAGRAAQHPRG